MIPLSTSEINKLYGVDPKIHEAPPPLAKIVETFTYHTDTKAKHALLHSKDIVKDCRAVQLADFDLLEFVNGYHLVYYTFKYYDEPPMTPFILTEDNCLTPVHDGDVIEKEWFSSNPEHRGNFDFGLRVPNAAKHIKVQEPQPPVYAAAGLPMCK